VTLFPLAPKLFALIR